MTAYKLYKDIKILKLENREEDKKLIQDLETLIQVTKASWCGYISKKRYDEICNKFKEDFPDYIFPNCIYFKGDSSE